MWVKKMYVLKTRYTVKETIRRQGFLSLFLKQIYAVNIKILKFNK